MADVEVSKRTLKQVLTECAQLDKKPSFKGPDNIRPDSRHSIVEVAEDHVVFQLLSDEAFVMPYASITALRVSGTAVLVSYR